MRAKPNQGASAGVPPALEEEGAQGDVLEAAVDLRLAGVHGEDRQLPLPPGGHHVVLGHGLGPWG